MGRKSKIRYRLKRKLSYFYFLFYAVFFMAITGASLKFGVEEYR